MNYYYDLVLNFLEDYYLFYDWLEFDNIEYVKKIPLYQVSSKCFKKIYEYNGYIPLEILKEIENKTCLKKGNLKYAFIVADKNNALALECNSDGLIITRSSLLLKDELNLLEYLYTLPIKDIDFKPTTKINMFKDMRKSTKIKQFIKVELNKLENENNIVKLKYLYLEWFKEKEDDVTKILAKMYKRLEKEITPDEVNIYNIIKLSYNNV